MQPNREKYLSILRNKIRIAHKGAAQKSVCSKVQYKVQKQNLKDRRAEYGLKR